MLPTVLVGGGARHGSEEVAQGVGEEWQWCPATTRMSGDKLQWRRGGGASRRRQCPFDRYGLLGGTVGGGEPRLLCPGPHLLLFGTVRRGPPTLLGWTPRSGRRSGPRLSHWVKSGGDQPNILPLDLNLSFKI
jgi:hypothetical protein